MGGSDERRDRRKLHISYEMYMPSMLHDTSKFTHIFQLKTPAANGIPVTGPAAQGDRPTGQFPTRNVTENTVIIAQPAT